MRANDGTIRDAPDHDVCVPRVDPIPALKRQLGDELARLLARWNADDVAALIGTDRWRISDLRRGKLDRFSLETLIRYLARLGHAVEITVVCAPSARASTKAGRRERA